MKLTKKSNNLNKKHQRKRGIWCVGYIFKLFLPLLLIIFNPKCLSGGTGRRAAFRVQSKYLGGGSSPPLSTI